MTARDYLSMCLEAFCEAIDEGRMSSTAYELDVLLVRISDLDAREAQEEVT